MLRFSALSRYCGIIFFILICYNNVYSTNLKYEWGKAIARTTTTIKTKSAESGKFITSTTYTDSIDVGIHSSHILNSNGNSDIALVKYDSLRNIIWAHTFGGVSNDFISDIEVDGNGSIYLSGKFSGLVDFDPDSGVYNLQSKLNSTNSFLLKLNANGNLLWVKKLFGDTSLQEMFLSADPFGNIFLRGLYFSQMDVDPDTNNTHYINLSSYSNDYYVLKLNGSGVFQWVTAFQRTTLYNNSTGIYLDFYSDGNFVLAGSFKDSMTVVHSNLAFNTHNMTGQNAFIMKWDKSGIPTWTKYFKSVSTYAIVNVNHFDIGVNNEIYALGEFEDTIDFNPSNGSHIINGGTADDFYLSKLDSIGNLIWVKTLITNRSITRGRHVSLVNDDELYITGDFTGTLDFDPGTNTVNRTSQGSQDFFLLQWDTSANYIDVHIIGNQSINRWKGSSTSQCGNVIIHGALGSSPIDLDPGPNNVIVNPIGFNSSFLVKLSPCSSSRFDTLSVCDSYTSPSGKIWSSSGSYSDTIPNAAGCDSIITIQLNILNSFSIMNSSACVSYTSPSGKIWSNSGTYSDTIPNTSGCDSIITVQLDILNSFSNLNTFSCVSYTSPSGKIWSGSGTYSDTIPNTSGCDSIITIQLDILNSFSNMNTYTCNSYTSSSGKIWSSSGTYSDTIPNYVGCDSIITINLIVDTINTNVTQIGDTLIASELNASYVWIDCVTGIPTGYITNTFSPNQNGQYAVIIYKSNCVDTSACILYNSVAVRDIIKLPNISIFPNPTRSSLKISLARFQTEIELILRNCNGQMLDQVSFNDVKEFNYNLNQAPGIYWIQLISSEGWISTTTAIKID